eukprot:956150-Pleurochrysis_carterae.AAC.1
MSARLTCSQRTVFGQATAAPAIGSCHQPKTLAPSMDGTTWLTPLAKKGPALRFTFQLQEAPQTQGDNLTCNWRLSVEYDRSCHSGAR